MVIWKVKKNIGDDFCYAENGGLIYQNGDLKRIKYYGDLIYQNGDMIYQNGGLIYQNGGLIYQNGGLIYQSGVLKRIFFSSVQKSLTNFYLETLITVFSTYFATQIESPRKFLYFVNKLFFLQLRISIEEIIFC